jgi:hypothetical protein
LLYQALAQEAKERVQEEELSELDLLRSLDELPHVQAKVRVPLPLDFLDRVGSPPLARAGPELRGR